MIEDVDYFYWTKGEALPLSLHFTSDEFSCQCDYKACAIQKIEKALIRKLETLRSIHNEPIHVTSGYRCRAHQFDLGKKGLETAVGISQHTLARAADVLSHDLDALQKDAGLFFKSIGRSAKFIHLDLRDDKERFWTYRDYQKPAQ